MTKKKKKIKKNDEDEEKIKERLRSLGYAWKSKDLNILSTINNIILGGIEWPQRSFCLAFWHCYYHFYF